MKTSSHIVEVLPKSECKGNKFKTNNQTFYEKSFHKNKKTYTQMIQVNRKTQHYRIYTLLYYTRTREKQKGKDNNQRQMKD